MGALRKDAFNSQYRFRDSRGSTNAARCELCVSHIGAGCSDHERIQPVLLSEYVASPLGRRGSRWDVAASRVCDRVSIEMPEGLVVPSLEEGHVVACGNLYHGNPNCPYVAACLRDNNQTAFGGQIRVIEVSGMAYVDPAHLCELPGCCEGISLKMWGHDEYLTRQGFNDGWTPQPPKPTFWELPDPEIGSVPLVTTLKIGAGSAYVAWTEESIQYGIIFVKNLVRRLGPSKWPSLAMALRASGWGEVIDRITFELQVMADVRYCISCALRTNLKLGAPVENPMRMGEHPHCPYCGRLLVHHTIFSNAMPE